MQVVLRVAKFLLFLIEIIIPIMSIPPETAISNIAKWLLFFGIEKSSIPTWVYTSSINLVMYFLCSLIALHWIVAIFLKVKARLTKTETKDTTQCTKNKVVNLQNDYPKLPDLLFTNINEYRSLFDIGKALDQFYNLPTGSIFSLLLQGYWKGEFDGNNTQGIDRITLLKNIHDTESINEHFIFAYSYAKKPNIITELPNGGCRIDIRPVLPVPNANTDTWTNENCKEAFEVFVKKFQYGYSYFPDCIPDFLHPGFMECKKISQDVLVGFLKKQKVI